MILFPEWGFRLRLPYSIAWHAAYHSMRKLFKGVANTPLIVWTILGSPVRMLYQHIYRFQPASKGIVCTRQSFATSSLLSSKYSKHSPSSCLHTNESIWLVSSQNSTHLCSNDYCIIFRQSIYFTSIYQQFSLQKLYFPVCAQRYNKNEIFYSPNDDMYIIAKSSLMLMQTVYHGLNACKLEHLTSWLFHMDFG